MGYFFLCKTRTSFLSIGVNFYFSKGQRKQQVYFFQETKKTTRKKGGGGEQLPQPCCIGAPSLGNGYTWGVPNA